MPSIYTDPNYNPYLEKGKSVAPNQSFGNPVVTPTQSFAGSQGVTNMSPSPTPSATTQIDTSKAPALPSSSGNIGATAASAITSGQDRLKQIEDIKKQIADLEVQKQKQAEVEQKDAERKSLLGKITDTFTKRNELVENQKSSIELEQEMLDKGLARIGVTPQQIQKIGGLISEVTEFNKQLADLESKKQNALDNAMGVPGQSIEFAGLEQNRISKVYNSEISAKALQAGVKVQELQMIQGAYDDAKATAGELVKLATYDQQQKVADIEWALGAYQDLYTMMDKEEQTQWDRQYTMAKDELDQATKEQTNKFNLIADAANKGINLSSLGTASYQEVVDAYAKQVGSYVATQDAINNADKNGSGGGGGTTNVNDVLQSAIDQGATPAEAARAAAVVYENMGIQVTQKDLNNWTAQASKLKKTIIPETPKQPKVISNVNANIAGKAVGQYAKDVTTLGGLGVDYIGRPLVEGTKAVGSFFSGLFGG